MSGLGYFFWLGWEALTAGPVLMPGLTCLAVAGVVVAVMDALGNRDFARPRSLWLLLPLLIPISVLAYGVVFAYDGPGPVPSWRGAVIDWLLFSHLPLAALLLWRLRGIRWVVAGVSAAQMWYSVCAGFMAGMSVTNVWL